MAIFFAKLSANTVAPFLVDLFFFGIRRNMCVKPKKLIGKKKGTEKRKKRQKRAKKSEKDAKKRKQTIIGFYLFIDRCLVGRPKPTIAKLWSSEHEAKANNIRIWRRQHSIRNNRKNNRTTCEIYGQIRFFSIRKLFLGRNIIYQKKKSTDFAFFLV